MGTGIHKVTERYIASPLAPAVREFLDGLAEIIARDILKHEAGQTDTKEKPDRANRGQRHRASYGDLRAL